MLGRIGIRNQLRSHFSHWCPLSTLDYSSRMVLQRTIHHSADPRDDGNLVSQTIELRLPNRVLLYCFGTGEYTDSNTSIAKSVGHADKSSANPICKKLSSQQHGSIVRLFRS